MLATLVKRLGGECTLDGSETAILGVTLDSRAVREGDLFVALKGLTGDGRAYIPQAVAAGAGAILQESGSVSAASIAVPVWVHSDARRLAGEIASEVFGNPSEQMDVFAITGTNGKTTTAHLIAELLRSTGAKPAVLGTTGFHLAQGVTLEATHTTPDAPELHRLLKQHRELGGDSVVLEVSSHALSQCRTAGLGIDFGIYTNLSRDHLDYHGDMQQYAVTKSLMFSSLQSSAVAILNRDDSWFEMMAGAAAESGARVVTYSAEGPADLQASELVFDTDVTYLTLSGMGISLTRLRIPLSGRFNVSNVLAASAAVLLRGASPAAVVAGLASISSPSGRLQRVSLGPGQPAVFVDFAHTPDALRQVLSTLREISASSAGRILCVFGCGGDRDPGKRGAMGAAAAELADEVFVTNDNPRGENPAAIADAICAGMERPSEVHVELDRRLAIRAALRAARSEDVVLIAGKGHESTQTIGETQHVFDDVQVVQEEAL